MSVRDEILAQCASLPSLPAASVDMVVRLKDPNADIRDLVELIEHDPGLTANVLKVANSAAMGSTRSVDSMQDALVRLGTNEVVKMVVSASLAPIVTRPIRGYDLMPGALWEHAIAVAVTSEEIARLRQIAPPSNTFTAGLLIDVGKLAMDQFMEVSIDPIRALAFDKKVSFEQAEREVLGIDHAEVGAYLLDAWKLPASLVEVVRWHHEPQKVSAQQQLVADLVHAADHVMTVCGVGGGTDGSNYRVSESAMSRFDLRANEIELLVSRSIEVFHKIQSQYAQATGG